MSDKPISDLRRRMIADMTVRSFSDKTQHDYIRHIETFTRFLGRERRRHPPLPARTGRAGCAETEDEYTGLGIALLLDHHTRPRRPRSSTGPHALTAEAAGCLLREQVARLIEAAPGPGLKYKTALSIAYGAGPRSGEVVMLRVGDIDSKRMLIRVEMAKGRKDRHAMLSPQLLLLLRAWWLQCRSRGWLFPGQDSLRPITVRQLNRVCHMAAEAAGLGSWVTPHTLRHSFATHLRICGRAISTCG
jgi:integrase/recombinase XerD